MNPLNQLSGKAIEEPIAQKCILRIEDLANRHKHR